MNHYTDVGPSNLFPTDQSLTMSANETDSSPGQKPEDASAAILEKASDDTEDEDSFGYTKGFQ